MRISSCPCTQRVTTLSSKPGFHNIYSLCLLYFKKKKLPFLPFSVFFGIVFELECVNGGLQVFFSSEHNNIPLCLLCCLICNALLFLLSYGCFLFISLCFCWMNHKLVKHFDVCLRWSLAIVFIFLLLLKMVE